MHPRPMALTSRPCPNVRVCISRGVSEIVVESISSGSARGARVRAGTPVIRSRTAFALGGSRVDSRQEARGTHGGRTMAKSGDVLEIPELGIEVRIVES